MDGRGSSASSTLVLPAGEAHVWRVSVDCASAPDPWSLLSEAERHRALALRSPIHRAHWIRARAALRDVLRRYIGSKLPSRFRTGMFGKPELQDHDWLRFNLSHSGQWALIAVAREREVGIDVEEVRRIDPEAVIRSSFSFAEREALSRLTGGAQLDAFYRCWTRKEAFVKALGLGLHADLTAFDVSVEAQPMLLDVRRPLPFHSRWTLADIQVDSRYKAAIAVQEGLSVCRLLEWHGPADRTTRLDFSPLSVAIVPS